MTYMINTNPTRSTVKFRWQFHDVPCSKNNNISEICEKLWSNRFNSRQDRMCRKHLLRNN